MTTRIQVRRGTAAQWTAANPVLADGEAGFSRDTGVFKIGDGVTTWNNLTSVYVLAGDLTATNGRVTALENEPGEQVVLLADNAVAENASYTAYPLGLSLMKATTGSGWSLNGNLGFVVTFVHSSSRVRQQFWGHLSNDVWTRWYGSSAWGPWIKTVQRLSATATLDFPSIPANSTAQLTVAVVGAALGDAVSLAPPSGLENGLISMGRVTAVDTVSVRLANVTTAAIDPASASWGVSVIK